MTVQNSDLSQDTTTFTYEALALTSVNPQSGLSTSSGVVTLHGKGFTDSNGLPMTEAQARDIHRRLIPLVDARRAMPLPDVGRWDAAAGKVAVFKEGEAIDEGALLAAFAMRAHISYIYIRGEFIREREVLQAAIDEASRLRPNVLVLDITMPVLLVDGPATGE